MHEVRAEHLAFAIEGVTSQERAFATRLSAQRADVIQLFAQLTFVDQLGPIGIEELSG